MRQALDDLGVDARAAATSACACTRWAWPGRSRPTACAASRAGLEEILVVEEKRQIIEYQLKEMLYGWRDDARPLVVGKFDESGEWPAPPSQWLLPPTGELSPPLVARAIAARLARFHDSEAMQRHLAALRAHDQTFAQVRGLPVRTPYFCSGCPHNMSTRVPEGSCALAGVGCHLMAVAWNATR